MSSEVFNSTSILETSKVLRLVDTGLEKLVDTGGSRLTYLAAPKDAKDAVNKEYLEEALKDTKEEFDAIKTSVDEAKADIDTKHSEVNKNFADVKAIKVELQEHLESIGDKDLVVTQKAQEVEAIKVSIESMKEAIDLTSSSIDNSKDEIAQNIETIQDIQEELNTQANQFRDDVAGFRVELEDALNTVEENLTDITNQHIEVDDKFIELRVITRDTKNELETLNQQLIDTADSVKDEIDTINQELIQTADDVKNEIYIEALRADMYNSTLKSQNTKAIELIDKLENQELVDEMYLVKGEVVHTSAKLAAQSLGMTLATGVAMAMRVKYEREVITIAELKAEYENTNNIAKDRLAQLKVEIENSNKIATDRLAQLDLLLTDADKMVRNSEFYNLIGVFI